ncbi:MAG TPA: hypothetical protein PKL48_01515, partial [Thermodesulfobacteriota bacterium]|nr:hypothetical protein [Thermodesulfobacteriota bacterium]
MTRREKAYNKKLESLIDQALTLQDDAVDRVNKILTATRTELAASLAQTPWEAHYLPQAKDAIERAIRGFEQQYKAEQSEALKTSWSAGVDMVDAPLAAAGIRLVAPEISPSTLGI